MSKLVWDQVGEKLFETGVDQGVLYPIHTDGSYPLGHAWNGLTGVTESPGGGEATAIYADNIKYLNLVSAEDFEGSIEAYTYPDEFEACQGAAEIGPADSGVYAGQQDRSIFGLSYRTVLGNDVEGNAHGYKIHIVYGCQVTPSEKAYQTINDSPEAINFSWDFVSTPVPVTGFKPTAKLTIDSTKVEASALLALEEALYGTAIADPYLPLPDEIITIITP